MKKTKPVHTVLYVPTLQSKDGTRHIIPHKDAPAYCGATGSQHFPHDHKADELCRVCVKGYMAALVRDRMKGVGL